MTLTHSGLALLGLAMVFLAFALLARPDWRDAGEAQLRNWLLARQEVGASADVPPAEPLAAERATASNPDELPYAQARVAFWLSQKYKVGAEPMTALAMEAYLLGEQVDLDPLLILSVVALESRFNPFAQSHAGAQGLMQVMTRVHNEKYESFGGSLAAFDPIANLRVGALVLKDCIQRAGSVEQGLRYYVGAAKHGNDGGYARRVMAEYARLQKVAAGAIMVDMPQAVVQNSAQNGSESTARS